MSPLAQSWLLQSAVMFLIIGSVGGLLVGAMLVFCPQRFQLISTVLNRWVSTRHLDKTLELSISLEPWFYRHRRVTGALTLAGALFVLFYFSVRLDRELAIAGLARHFSYPASIVAGLLDALVLSALTGALCAILVALFMLFRPSLLLGFEQNANQWVSLRKALKPMERSRDNLDRYVLRHARQIGIFLLLGGLYTLVLLLYWLNRQQ